MIRSAVFVSYSHRDEAWKELVLMHLAPLAEKISIKVWDDTRIPFGSEWATNLWAELSMASVALLLLSADFLSSEFIREVEVPVLLAREAEGKVRLLPIVLRPCAWKTVPWLANRLVYPVDGKSLSSLTESEAENQLAAIVGEIIKYDPVADAVPVAVQDASLEEPESGELQEAGEGHFYDDGWAGLVESERAATLAAARALQLATKRHSDANKISVIIEVPDASRLEASGVPTSMTAGELLRALANPDNFESSTHFPAHSALFADSRHQLLNPDQTLHEQNVADGDTLHIYADSTAGCFPLDTLVALPDGRTASLGSLRVGDAVASPRPHVEEDSIARVNEVIREHAARLVVVNAILRVTPDHGVFCVSRGGRWIPASRLRLGDFLLRGDRRVVAVRTLAMEDSDLEVGNLVLQHPEDAFVANGVVVFGARRTRLGALMKSLP